MSNKDSSKRSKMARSFRKFFGIEEPPKRESWDKFEYDEDDDSDEGGGSSFNPSAKFGGKLGSDINRNVRKYRKRKRK